MNQYDREHWDLPIDPPEVWYCECGERLRADEVETGKCPDCQKVEELWYEEPEEC